MIFLIVESIQMDYVKSGNIETRFEVNGWICGKFDNKDYVEVLEKE